MRATILEAHDNGTVRVLFQPKNSDSVTTTFPAADLPTISDEFTGTESAEALNGRSFECKVGSGLMGSGILPTGV